MSIASNPFSPRVTSSTRPRVMLSVVFIYLFEHKTINEIVRWLNHSPVCNAVVFFKLTSFYTDVEAWLSLSIPITGNDKPASRQCWIIYAANNTDNTQKSVNMIYNQR